MASSVRAFGIYVHSLMREKIIHPCIIKPGSVIFMRMSKQHSVKMCFGTEAFGNENQALCPTTNFV